MSYFVGIDQSLTSTGIVVLDATGDHPVSMVNAGSKSARGGERLAMIGDVIEEMLNAYTPFILALEGYSVNSQNRPFDLGEIGGLVRYLSFKHGVKYLVVPPAALKKFVTGNGNADKEKMQKAVAARWNVTIDQNDLCDAYGLARVGRAYFLAQVTTRAEAEVVHMLKQDKEFVQASGKIPTKRSV